MKSSSVLAAPRRFRRSSVLCVVFVAALALTACGGGSATSSVTLPPLGSAVTLPPTGSVTTTTAGGSVTTVSPSTTRGRACDAHPGVKCINIRSIAISGNSLVIEWDALNFTPSLQSFHAHFFWDIYTPQQAGTNAAKFGATVAKWELTDKQPFKSEDEMRVANRPPAAKNVCVEVADVSHALVDPTVFDCIPIPAS